MRSRDGLFKMVFAVVLLGLLIFLGSTKIIAFMRESVLAAAKPILKASMPLRRWLSFANILSAEEAEQLFREKQQLQAEAAEVARLREENRAFRTALRFAEDRSMELRGGTVMHYGKEFGKEFLLVERGKRAGVRSGDLAVDTNGFLVGIVKEAYEEFSRVEIASNPGETFEVEIIPLKVRALAKGLGARSFTLELLPADAPVAVGDFVILLGIGGGRYSLPLGQVADLKRNGGSAFKEGRGVLLADPESMREIFFIESR